MSYCLSRLVEREEEGYSPAALERLSDRRKFPHQLDFDRSEVMKIQAEKATKMSISGVQEKISLKLERGNLEPVVEGGQYILKPVPATSFSLPRLKRDLPANENLTMQIAEQVFGIDTAANACIRLSDGELAYITRRFDRKLDGTKVAQEDFCQLMGRTPERDGRQYKYDSSYEELGQALEKYCGAYVIEIEKLFCRIVFNYLVANGDAHLKNFSLRQSEGFGDYVLTPAYDLVCTKLHLPDESRFALDFYAEGEYPASMETHGFVTGADLVELARRFGISEGRTVEILDEFCEKRDKIEALIGRSFLSDEAKEIYADIVADRRQALEIRSTQ